MKKEGTQELDVFNQPTFASGFEKVKPQKLQGKTFKTKNYTYTNIIVNKQEQEITAIREPHNPSEKRLKIQVVYMPEFDVYREYQWDLDKNGKINPLATPIWFETVVVKKLYFDLMKAAE